MSSFSGAIRLRNDTLKKPYSERQIQYSSSSAQQHGNTVKQLSSVQYSITKNPPETKRSLVREDFTAENPGK
ncbi:MAG: hypothetical protein DBX61_09215 [Clostridiales bacterium]|nr:MAG: hypothetical protein DBX61_09215 [Clostridiales bacterium]